MADEPAADDLNIPLGQQPPAKRAWRIPAVVPRLFAGLLGAIVLGFAAWVVLVDDPLGGEPVAVVSTRAAPKPPPAAAPPPQAAGTPAQPPAPGGETQTVTIIDGSSGKRQEVSIPASGQPAAANEGLLEQSRHGAIPRIAPDGTRPAEAYASRATIPPGGARVAIVIGRMGISAATTAEALAKLPAAVTLAFPPYGTDLERWALRARGEGRELLLQVPLEPFDYPDNDPGPQTLLTSLPPEQNIDRLHWSLSRFKGYVGVANYMGARFAGNEQAMAAVLRDVAKRGLIYFDDGSARRGVAGQIAGATGLAFAKADLVLDAGTGAAEIDAALARLEALARERGSAVGAASATPLSVERIARWAKAVSGRGIVLVPLTALAARPKSS